MIKFLTKHKLLVAILLLGIFLRVYKPAEFFMYSHDNDLSSWFVKDVVVDGHLRLIGQLTSTPGIFIGPLFYYLLIPFYVIFNMDPIGSVYLGAVFGGFSILSFYFIFTKLFSKKEGLIASFLYSSLYFFVFNDREIVPTLPVVVWSLWFFYALNLFLKGDKKAYILSAILIALIWHFNFALVLVLPLIPLAILLSRQKINFKYLALSVVLVAVLSMPLLLFEIRHDFSQTNALINSLTTDQHDVARGIDKVDRVMQVVLRNMTTWIFGSGVPFVRGSLLFILGLGSLWYLKLRKIISGKLFVLIFSWIILFIGFFSGYSKVLSEYYLNGMAVIWLTILVLVISNLRHDYANFLLFGIIFLNLTQFATFQENKIGYLQKKELTAFIKADALKNNYPCVSVSYITDPGYELGYRYFYYLEGLHVNQPKSLAPVYTIVFPHSRVDRIDKSFGALGLVLPDYTRYNEVDVAKSCSGKNANLTDPMFGFTK